MIKGAIKFTQRWRNSALAISKNIWKTISSSDIEIFKNENDRTDRVKFWRSQSFRKKCWTMSESQNGQAKRRKVEQTEKGAEKLIATAAGLGLVVGAVLRSGCHHPCSSPRLFSDVFAMDAIFDLRPTQFHSSGYRFEFSTKLERNYVGKKA